MCICFQARVRCKPLARAQWPPGGSHVCKGQGARVLGGITGLWCVDPEHGSLEIYTAVNDQFNSKDHFSP